MNALAVALTSVARHLPHLADDTKNLCLGAGTCNSTSSGVITDGNGAAPTKSSLSSVLTGKIGNITDALLIVAGAIAVIIIIVGGIRYITSTGDATRIKQAKDTILYAVIGLVAVILAYAIVKFVSTSLT